MPHQCGSNVLPLLKGNLVRVTNNLNMPSSHSHRAKTQPSGQWRRLVMQLNFVMNLAAKWVTSNLAIREVKHRAPALMGYAEAMIKEEIRQAQETTLPRTLPPSTTAAPGQTSRVIKQLYPVPTDMCPHEVEHARRIGNKHGKFLECVMCGTVKKALDAEYVIPISGEKVNVYALQHGIRNCPGGKVDPSTRQTPASSASLAKCYLRSLPQASEPHSRTSGRRTSGRIPSTNRDGYPMSSPVSPESEMWEQVGNEPMEEDQ